MPTLSLPFAGSWGSFPVTQPYGPTANEGEPSLFGYHHFHSGIDFAMPLGTAVLAAADGTVIAAGLAENNGLIGFGNVVTIDHGDGVTTLYGHNTQLLVAPGQQVRRGQPIALSGSTGWSSGPHLHFQTNRGAGYSPTSPLPYLSGVPSTFVGPLSPQQLGAIQGGGVLSYADVVYYARGAGIPEGEIATCVAIAAAESGRDPRAVNNKNSDGSVDRGLWQVNSVHCAPRGPYNAQALFDPGYNARAMAAIYRARGSWSDWTTFTTTNPTYTYRQYLAAATAAVAGTPVGYTPAIGASVAAAGAAGGQIPAQPQDTTPQQPVIKVTVAPVTPRLDLFHSTPGTKDTALVWIAGVYMDVLSLAFTVSEFETPGECTDATLALTDVPAAVRAALRAREFTQVIIYGGFVDDLPAQPDQVLPLWTGVADSPTRAFDAGTYSLSGPDYSGVFSNPNATTSDLSQVANSTGAEIVTRLVAGHNTPGAPGLTVRADSSALKGQAFGSNTLSTRQTATTEWDTMTALSQGDTKTLFWEGTTLYYQDLPPEGTPLYLNYKVDGDAGSLLTNPVIADQVHAKRDVRVEVSSYSSTAGSRIGPAIAGNHDNATTVKREVLPPNSSLDACQKRANWLANIFAATAYTLTCAIEGIVPLARGQAIVIVSDDPDMHEYAGQHWYPTKREYKYDASGGGWSMALTCTNLPYTVSAKVQTSGATAAIGNLGG